MTVKELKEALAAYPDDMEIALFVEGNADKGTTWSLDTEDLTLEVYPDNKLVIK